MAQPIRLLNHAFSSGELTPELFSRVDFAKAQEGLAICRNFVVLPHGPVVNRAGTEFIYPVKDSSHPTQLLSFSYNNVQTYVIEVGNGYFRFHTQGAILLYLDGAAYDAGTGYTQGNICKSAGVNYYCVAATTGNAPPNATYWYALPTAPNIYEIPSPYSYVDVMDIHIVQSADVLTLAHPNYPVGELRRYGASDWRYVLPAFVPPANLLTSVAAAPGVGTGAVTYSYVVTGIAPNTLEETVASATVSCTNDLTVATHTNVISWVDSTGGAYIRYQVYKLTNGLWAYIGMAAGTTFTDNYITANTGITPPIPDPVFASTGNYPQAVSYAQQRRCFAGTTNTPQNLWMTCSGTESNMSYSIPSQADNRIAIRIAAREASAIRHIVPVGQLLLLSATCEWRVSSSDGGAITPTTISVQPQSYTGASNVSPVVVDNLVLYAASRGGHIREMSYQYTAQSYVTNDVSLLAPHLFDYNTVMNMAYSRGPVPSLWCVSSTGQLLGMTYIPAQSIAAWHRHDTGLADTFESVACVTENGQDSIYVTVKRTINGVVYRYVERFHSRLYATLADSFFVDCGATYNATVSHGGVPVTSVSGIGWLEGMTVNILADGAVMPPQVVTGGSFTLQQPATLVTFGLPITADLETLPVVLPTDQAGGVGRPVNVNQVWLRTYRSSGISVGPDFSHLVEWAQRTNEPYGSPPSLRTDTVGPVMLTAQWASQGQICVRHTDPLPLDISSITYEVAVGG